MSTTKMILEKAKALIADEKKRTTGAFARDEKGEWVNWKSDNATCWCSLGAVLKAADEEGVPDGKAYETLQLTARNMTYGKVLNSKDAVVYVNDNMPHDQVMFMFDLAIKAAI